MPNDDLGPDATWQPLPAGTRLPLAPGEVHVWRMRLDLAPTSESPHPPPHWAVLSADEHARAARFFLREHGDHYATARGTLRHILGAYLAQPPASLRFSTGAHGKPALVTGTHSPNALEFNLSHSAGLALVAVAQHGAVGVDVEWHRDTVQHLAVARRFFSGREQQMLAALGDAAAVKHGFFAAWSRKEAYLKATGHGISRGLHHFDVSLEPGAPAALLADRLDASAVARWTMANIEAAPHYSAALVAARPVTAIRRYHVTGILHPT